jgi:hypothetical protein
MALFNFGKKSDSPQGTAAPGQANSYGLPVEQVTSMRQQGMSNNQIVQTLQRDGYDSARIFDALSQADMQTGAPIQGYGQQDMGSIQQQPMPAMGQMPADQGMMMGPQQYSQQYSAQPMGGERERIEEMAETIIDEKWDELIKNINKIVEWKDKTEARILKMEQEMKDLKDSFDKLHKAIIGKISDYDQNIINVGTEIKAMERVFQKILPTFTDNVNELSRITKSIKKPGTQARQ